MSVEHDDPIARALAPKQSAVTETQPGSTPAQGSVRAEGRTSATPEPPCFVSREDGMVVTLDLAYRNGDHEAFPYSLLARIAYDRSDGITLEYVGAKVEISGSRLDELYKALCGQRVLRILEAPDGFSADNGAVFVERIEVSAT